MSLHQLLISSTGNMLVLSNNKNPLSAYLKLLVLFIFLIPFSNLHAQITSACGIYTGTGATKTFTTLGFTPDVVIIKAVDGRYAFMKTTDMGTNKSISMDGVGTIYTNAITALGTNGFTLSTNSNVNNTGIVYYFYAFKESADLIVSTYTGDAAASRTISTSFKVAWALTAAGTVSTNVGVGTYMSASSTKYEKAYQYSSGSGSSYCSGCTPPATGFDLASSTAQNRTGVTYYYFAIKAVAGYSEVGSYTGTTATQTITTSLTPTFISTLGAGDFMMRSSVSPASDATQHVWLNDPDETLDIKSLGTTKFVLGTNTLSNNKIFGVGVPYQYFAFGNSTILPVELTEFSGTCVSNGVQLNWATASELNNDYFLIEKSTDGYNWATIDKVKGSRHSITTTKYVSNDDAPYNGLVYYRLSQVDIDGKVTVFKAIDIVCNFNENSTNQLILFPNPSSSSLNISISVDSPSKNNTMLLINNMGQVVFEKNIDFVKGSNLFTFPINLASGSYTVLFNSNYMVVPSKKLIIINQ